MPRPERLELLRTNPLIEITLLHRAMRLELEAMCEATRALAAAPANDGAALAALRRRFRAFDAVFASHSAAEDDVVFPALAACAGRDVASHAAAEHIDEVALVDGAAAALDAAARAAAATARRSRRSRTSRRSSRTTWTTRRARSSRSSRRSPSASSSAWRG